MGEDTRNAQPSNIPILRATGGEVLSDDFSSRVVLSSACTNWRNFVVEEHCFSSRKLGESLYIQHVIAVNIGPPVICHLQEANGIRRVYKPAGTIFFAPSHEPFFRYCHASADNVSANVLYVALDPVFLSQTAASLEIYPDRVKLFEHHRASDPPLWHIVMALRAGIRGGRTNDRMYGESLSTALAVHVLREYCGLPQALSSAQAGLPREKLVRVIEFIHDQLHMDLTVSEIARTVHMSPHHFTTLFKKATGQSPYRYVIEARARRAKELLQSGNFSIADVAYRVGFADQSHLTRHFKDSFGITPKMFVKSRSV